MILRPSWSGPAGASPLPSDESDRSRSLTCGLMMTATPLITRGVHYTALVEMIDHHGATKLDAGEREQLLEAADVLLFGEPESESTVRSAELLIEGLETSGRWPAESCDQLREHLFGCDAPTGVS